MAPEVDEIARRLGSCNRLKRLNRWYSSVLKGVDGAKTCFASLGVILPEGVESKIRRCLFCFFSETKDADWLIPVTMVPFHHQHRSLRQSRSINAFEATARVIGASSSDPRTCSDTTTKSVLESSSTGWFTLTAIFYRISDIATEGSARFCF
jgi:hypothetical protein